MSVSATGDTWTDSPPDASPRPPRRFGRRRLLQGVAALGTLAIGGPLAYRAAFGRGTPAPGLKALTRSEWATVDAAAQVYLPARDGLPAGEDVGAVQFVDTYVANLPDDLARLMKFAIRSLEWTTVLNGGELSRFSKSSLPTRAAVLDAWENSKIYARRAGVFSIKWALAMGYFEQDQVRQAMGWGTPCPPLPPGSIQEWL